MNGRVADSMLVNTALMLIYITKFYWWESGYWCTMDIAHDRGRNFIYFVFNGNISNAITIFLLQLWYHLSIWTPIQHENSENI
jgi:hypothetical protein